jgi:hypothetical protein
LCVTFFKGRGFWDDNHIIIAPRCPFSPLRGEEVLGGVGSFFLGGSVATCHFLLFGKQWGSGANWAQTGLGCLEVSRGITYLGERRFRAFVVDLRRFFRFRGSSLSLANLQVGVLRNCRFVGLR